MRSGLVDINVLARGASNAKWHSGCLAPDRCVESICDWLIRGPLFCAVAIPYDRHSCLSFSPKQPEDRQECLSYEQLNEVPSHGPYGGLRTIGDADLSQNVLHMLFHRLVADAERLGDFFVGEAESKLFEDFTFPFGQ